MVLPGSGIQYGTRRSGLAPVVFCRRRASSRPILHHPRHCNGASANAESKGCGGWQGWGGIPGICSTWNRIHTSPHPSTAQIQGIPACSAVRWFHVKQVGSGRLSTGYESRNVSRGTPQRWMPCGICARSRHANTEIPNLREGPCAGATRAGQGLGQPVTANRPAR